jgi:hypothetical protein
VLLPPGERYLCADADGFNVHAHTNVGADHKDEKERLCRYILRPALCGKRLSLLPSGDDLGQSGASATWREGFQRLAKAVAQGKAGAVFALEMSRKRARRVRRRAS